ncbi:MAG: hypothetical protein HY658_07825 [Actinobacteria bacterium]|nr:hypothetical protein [Actinomycetota bacterium]
MPRIRPFLDRWLPVLVAFVLGASLTGIAGAHGGSPEFLHANHSDRMFGTLTANNFKFAAPKVSRLSIPAAALDETSEAATFQRTDSYGYTLHPSAVATAPVNLPHGARVIRVEWVHQGGAPPGTATLHLERLGASLDDQDLAVVDSVMCSETACTSVTTAISFPVINNGKFGYGIWIENDSTQDFELYFVVIVYTVTTPGP